MPIVRPVEASHHAARASLPEALSGTQAPGWVPALGLGMWELGSLRNFVYLIADFPTKTALLVDPQKDLRAPLEALEREGLRLVEVLLTHTHFDHIAGLPELLTKFPELRVRVGEADVWRLKATPKERISPIAGGTELTTAPSSQLGQTEFRYLAAPGHSAGALLTFFERGEHAFLLTGDTLFIRDCGRTDLETGSVSEMFETIQRARREIPADTILLCGHHYAGQIATVLEAELDESGPFLCQTCRELEELP